ncbi:BglG family transcription antiterminator [Paenibacillus macerans]|uniref:BglG family transcription antiterminator n=1 Tax=Paenibacillus macerans TaxID=44252 RepID=UPI003D30F9FB
MLDERSSSILALLQKTQGYLPVQELMDVLRISKRTVYYDMDKINDWLRQSGLPPVQYLRGRGFMLPDASRSRLPAMAQGVQPQQYYLSSSERKALLCLHLINRSAPLFLHDMEDLLKVSRGTAHAELKRLKEELESYALCVRFDRKEGYYIQGNEKDLRAALSRFLFEQLPYADWNHSAPTVDGLIHTDLFRSHFPAFREEELASVYRMIVSSEQLTGMELTDETILHLTVRIWLSANRMKQGQTVKLDEEEKAALRETLRFKAAAQIAAELEKLFGIGVPEDEIGYMTIYLLAAKVNRVEVESDTWDTKRLRAATEEVIDLFEQNGCVYFQNREALAEQLFLHVKSVFYRIQYGLTLDNPLTDKIMEEYREVFELTRKSVQPLEREFEKPLNQHEIAYLSMHFGGWLRREQAKPVPGKRAAVVCVNGISASRLLKNQLEQLFPSLDLVAVLSLREFEKFTGNIDLIFSTVPLSGCQVPVFILNAVMSDAEKAHLLGRVNPYLGSAEGIHASLSAQAIVDLVGKHATITDKGALLNDLQRYLSAAKGQPPQPKEYKPTLGELLHPSRITIRGQASDWRQAIRTAARPLLREGAITDRYVQAMIGNVERYGPYIIATPGVAIAHARPEDGAVRPAISLLAIQGGAAFSDQPKHLVNLLFVVVGTDGQLHLKALTQLANLLMEERNRQVLGSTDDKAEMMRLFLHYSGT